MIHIGTCGFSYKDWVGPFYPPGTKPAEMLELYARSFGAVEIDSTYYAIPKPGLFASMARRTPTEFRFTVKAPGSISHLPASVVPADADFDDFETCLAPLQEAGKLGAVLLQLPGSFVPGDDAWARLALIGDRWSGLPLVAEFRHSAWQRPAVLHELRERGLGFCNVDEPRRGPLMRPSASVTSPVGYVRFHGRNAAKWWKQDRSPAERYDYLYSESELSDWLPLVAEVADRAAQTYVFFNNHRNGQAGTNARQMARMLGLSRPQAPQPPASQIQIFENAD